MSTDIDKLRENLGPLVFSRALHDSGIAQGKLESIDRASINPLVALHQEIFGLGDLEQYLKDPTVTDIVIQGNGTVTVDRGDGLEECDEHFMPGQTTQLALHLAEKANQRLDASCPSMDGMLPIPPAYRHISGIRVHALLSPPANEGAEITLRILSTRISTIQDLIDQEVISEELEQIVDALITGNRNILICGATGAGKTTLLSALTDSIDTEQRIVLMEDTPEIYSHHPGLVSLRTRKPNAEGRGEITLQELVRHSLRMRPDRLIIGEIRGVELIELLLALNTGHNGSMATIHANDLGSVSARLEALAGIAGLGLDALTHQVMAGIDVVVFMNRTGSRRVLSSIGIPYVESSAGSHTPGRSQGIGIKPLWNNTRARDLGATEHDSACIEGEIELFPGWEEFCEQLGVADPYEGSD